MPAVMISGCVFLVVSTTIAFIFTCQTNFEEKENEKGKKFFRRITRMTVSGRNVPKTKKSSLESFQSEQSKPSSKSSEANKKQNEHSSKKVQETKLRKISFLRAVKKFEFLRSTMAQKLRQ